MKHEMIAKLHGQFEDYPRDVEGIECLLASELQGLLGYTRW